MELKNNLKVGKVLVLGEDSRSFLAVVRSLGRKGLIVHVAGFFEDEIALSSKYIAKAHSLPSYHQCENWKTQFIKIITREQFDLVIPTNDKNNILLQNIKHDIGSLVKIYLLDELAFKSTHNKLLTYKIAVSEGVTVPKYYTISNNEEVEEISKSLCLPVFLKPLSSFSMNNLRNKSMVIRVDTPKQFFSSSTRMLSNGEIIVQENFNGVGVGLEVLAYKGDILVSFQHIRVHEPIGGGGSSYRKSMNVDIDLLKSAEKILKKIDYTGVAMLEYKVDFFSGMWALIEINGRFWGSLPLAVSLGVDFPYYLYQMLAQGKHHFVYQYRSNRYCRNTSNDLGYIVSNLLNEKKNFATKINFLVSIFFELKNILLLREGNDTLVIDDLKPGIMEIRKLLILAAKSFSQKIFYKFESIAFIRRKNQNRINYLLNHCQRILFVCKGNICRSPFAEQYAKKVFPPGISLESCGYYPISGKPCPNEAIMAAQDYRINLSDHQSKIIHDEMVNRADIIFTFDMDNKIQVIKRYPEKKHSVFLLSDISPKDQKIIFDPHGKKIEAFQCAYHDISKYIDILGRYFSNCKK
jgi:protein-tyrosine-phosphatase/predicted ATP-grasp superfamily ATP-dependent carboligase